MGEDIAQTAACTPNAAAAAGSGRFEWAGMSVARTAAGVWAPSTSAEYLNFQISALSAADDQTRIAEVIQERAAERLLCEMMNGRSDFSSRCPAISLALAALVCAGGDARKARNAGHPYIWESGSPSYWQGNCLHLMHALDHCPPGPDRAGLRGLLSEDFDGVNRDGGIWRDIDRALAVVGPPARLITIAVAACYGYLWSMQIFGGAQKTALRPDWASLSNLDRVARSAARVYGGIGPLASRWPRFAALAVAAAARDPQTGSGEWSQTWSQMIDGLLAETPHGTISQLMQIDKPEPPAAGGVEWEHGERAAFALARLTQSDNETARTAGAETLRRARELADEACGADWEWHNRGDDENLKNSHRARAGWWLITRTGEYGEVPGVRDF